MLTIVQNKTIDFLEYTLQVLEKYDKEFEERRAEEKKNKSNEEDADKKSSFTLKLSDIVNDYKDLAFSQGKRGLNYVQGTQAYKIADDYVDFKQKYESTYSYTTKVYESLRTEVIVPVHSNILVIYDTSSQKMSLIVNSMKNSSIAQVIHEKFQNTKVLMTQNWLKLDFNQMGKVSITDLIATIKGVQELVKHMDILVKANELKKAVYQRAITYLDTNPRESRDDVNENEKSDSSSDSVELQKLVENDD